MMKVELRNNTVTISGYVNAVARDSRRLNSPQGAFVEQVKPGTFTKAMQRNSNPELRFNHSKKLGDVTGGELRLREDNIGLYAVAVTADLDVIKAARGNRLQGWSFAFRCLPGGDVWEKDDDISRRYLNDIELREVSILTITPAYIATSIETRNGEEIMTERRNELEEIDYSIEDVEEPEQRLFALENHKKVIKILKIKEI